MTKGRRKARYSKHRHKPLWWRKLWAALSAQSVINRSSNLMVDWDLTKVHARSSILAYCSIYPGYIT